MMTRRIAALAATAIVSAGMTLGATTARAEGPTSGTWCPGQPVPGGFTEVDWDWNVCHNFYAMQSGFPPQIVGLKVEDGAIGGSWRLVAGQDTNVTCQFLGCPRP